MTVYQKIIFSSSLVAALAAFAGMMAWKNMEAIKGVYTQRVGQYHELVEQLEVLQRSAHDLEVEALVRTATAADSSLAELPAWNDFTAASQNLQSNIAKYQNRGTFSQDQLAAQVLKQSETYAALGQKKSDAKKLHQEGLLLKESINQLSVAEYADCQKVGSEIVGFLKSMLVWIIGISLSVCVLALVFGQLIARGLAKALDQLKAAANRLEDGDYTTRVLLQGQDEFRKIGATFNQVAEDLEKAKIIEDQNTQLETLNQQLKLKNDSLDSFVYRVSHDLKAPVVNLKSLLGMVNKQVKSENGNPEIIQKSLFFMNQSATRLEQTIYDLLEVSRIERHLQEAKELLVVEAIVDEVLQENVNIIESSEAVFNPNFDAAPHLFFARPNLKSILANVITNSLKYRSADRPLRVKLETTPVAGYTCLSISDNGIGLDLEKHRDKLFGMFNRFHNHVEGSGVGLYIVKKLMDENGGKLEIESQLNVGTTLKIYFALAPKITKPLSQKTTQD